VTSQGLRVYHTAAWISGLIDVGHRITEQGLDVGTLADGFVSVTPVQLDLTAYRALTDLNSMHWDDFFYESSLLETSDELTLFHKD
jgi:5'-nucleotidase